MNVLGIIGFGESPSACLMRDGKLTAFIEEEKVLRLKGISNVFPEKAVAWCLNSEGLGLEDIDKIAFAWDAKKYPWKVGRNFIGNYFKYRGRANRAHHVMKKDSSSKYQAIETLLEYHPKAIESKIQAGLRAAGFAGKFPEVVFVPHHLTHAYSTYFCSPFQKAGILTLDGSGEDICTQLAIGEGDKVRVIENFPIPHSLGWFYASICQYLGFIPYRDEGKLMGLAALGEAKKDSNKWIAPLSKILKIKGDSYEVDPIYTKFGGHYYGDRFTDELYKLITSVDPAAQPIMYGEKVNHKGQVISKYLTEPYIDIAWAAQELLEQAAIMLGKKLVDNYGVENLCVAGGVAMNCKMNGEILRRSGAKNIFAQPASSDGGTALGAAMIVSQQMGADVRNVLEHAQYGPEYTNDDVLKLLKNSKLKYEKLDDAPGKAAELLEEGKIVSWFQGRQEIGARALGGRSILANPTIPNMKDKVNNEVKYRESWRPFCPSMAEEKAEDYLVDLNEAAFMIVAYEVHEPMKDKIPAAVHVDGTARPQVVKKNVTPKYHDLITRLGQKTGHPVVLNTSFNVRGEPIVSSPLEAVKCFYSNGLDALVIEDFLLTK